MSGSILSLLRRWRCVRRAKIPKEMPIDEEKSWGYEPTRYCHIRIGDTLGGRFRILGKLGWGQFSTVWFARDIEKQQWVSVKVSTRWLLRGPWHERDVMKALDHGNQDHPGCNHVVRSHASFVHEGPNGQHICLVYPAMGESLSLFKSRMPDHKLPLYIMKRVSRQLLQALDFTHACGLTHTDVSLRNILCELDETVIAHYLKAIPKPHVLAKAPPNRPIPSTGMRAPVDVRNLNIRLSDFGQAVSSSDRTKDHQGGDRTMRAPEVIMGLPWDSKVDIWNVACLIWEAFENRYFFDGRVRATDKYSAQGHLSEIVHHFGPAPNKLVERQITEYFKPDGTVIGVEPMTFTRWPEWEENLKGDEQVAFLEFIGSMLRWLPEDRPSAKEALEHRWLQD